MTFTVKLRRIGWFVLMLLSFSLLTFEVAAYREIEAPDSGRTSEKEADHEGDKIGVGATMTNTMTLTSTPTMTNTAITSTPTIVSTLGTNTPTLTATIVSTPPTHTPTSTPCVASSPTFIPTNTPTMTATSMVSSTATMTGSPTMTATFSATPTMTATFSATPTMTATFSATPTMTFTLTATPTMTATPTITPTITSTPHVTATLTLTPTPCPKETPTSTPTSSPTNTPTSTLTNTPTSTPTSTLTNTPTNTPTSTLTNTPTNSPTVTATMTPTPQRLYLPIVVGGGAAAAPTATPSPTSALPTVTPTPSTSPPTDNWLEYVNYYRAIAGVPSVTDDATLNDNCFQHARYMAENNDLTHDQNPDLPWASDAGQICAQKGNAWLGGAFSSPIWERSDSIEGWMSSVGHRLWLLYPTTPTFGYGFSTASDNRAGAALDVLSRATFDDDSYNGWPIRYPVPNQISIPATNYAITLNWPYFEERPTISSTSLTTEDGSTISHEADTKLSAGHKGIQILPKEELPDNTIFIVTITGSYDGTSFSYSWRFSTGDTPIR